MNQDLQNLEIKVENEGTTPQGRLTATEWNILVAAVKSLDLTGGSVDVTSILQAVADAGYATQEWVNNQDYATTTDFNKFVKDFVTLNTEQAISGIKDFTNGLKIGGLSAYKSQADTIYLDANLVVRGGITAFGTNETITPSIFEALPIDGVTLKRTENGVLYVDTTVVGGGGGTGGGISIADVENYLTTNGYATQSWVTGRGYLTGITGTMVTSALGYTPVEKNEALTTADNNAVGYGYSSGGWGDFGPTIVFGSGSYRAALQSSGSNTNLRYGYTAGANSFTWKTIAFTSDIPTSLKNPNALSWSGYSSGSYDGSSAKSITIPNNTNQLTNGAGFITATASITGNAATATKLKNAVSLWGRTFDGSADLTGSLTVTTGEGYRINYNGYDLRFIVSGSSSNRGIWDNTNNNWLMCRSGSNDIYFTSGNIGFGTTSPTEKVTVGGNINLSGAYKYKIQGNDVVSIYSTNYYLADSAIELGYNTFIVGRKIKFQTSATTTKVTTATLDESGNFSVNGVIKLPLTATNAFSGAQLLFAGGVGRIGVNTNNMMAFYADTFRLRPASTSSAASSIGVLIDKDSNLSTTGDLQASGVLRLPVIDSGFANPRIVFGDSVIRIGATTAGLLGVYASGDIRLNPNSASSANGTMGLWLKTTGYNGINTSNPAAALHVNGKGIFADATNPWVAVQRDGINWYMQVTSGGMRIGRSSALGVLIDASGNMVAPGGVTATNSSDERLKRNIRKFNAREVLMSLGGVYQYEYLDSEVQKNHIYEGTHYGLIYQHVKGTALDVMCHKREDGMGALNYIHPKFISLIAGATMENISEVEKLKRKIRHLENKVKQLEQRA